MATSLVNKVVYNGQVLIDLTADTVVAEKLLKGFNAHDKSGALIEGTCDFDVNSQSATAVAAELLVGKTAYAKGSKVTGTMPNRGQAKGTINAKDGKYVIQNGYHDGSGYVELDATEKAKLVAENIREGVTVLGVEGTMTGTEDANPQTVTVTPTAAAQTIVPDTEEGYNYLAQVTVNAIPYTETDNDSGGKTVTIA